MAITSTGLNAATNEELAKNTQPKDKSILGKDDFMKLFLVELQHQDPTAPMDTEKILTQTSQLASLESSENTKKALEALTLAMSKNQSFANVSAIGKTADLGSDAISLDEGYTSKFEVYFPKEIKTGTLNITDLQGNTVRTIPIEENAAGVYLFEWDGKDQAGNMADSGVYRVNADYFDNSSVKHSTRLGAYPIEAVRFEEGKTFVKLGSNYVELSDVVEVY